MNAATVHHETIHFTGRVQGVGFRYSVLQIAKEYDVCGFVKNLTDGRVMLEVEGSQTDVADFVAAIETDMAGYVRQVERSAESRPAQFTGFDIR